MQRSVLLDTSFLISLVNPERASHGAAKEYYKYFIDHGFLIYLSVIVVSEFCQKQPYDDLPHHNFIVLPYNLDDALLTAELVEALDNRRGAGERAELRNDTKLIAQTEVTGIEFIIAEDKRTLYKWHKKLKDAGKCESVVIINSEGFSEAYFNGGQEKLFVI